MSKISSTKRLFSVILSLLLILSSVPLTLTAFAAPYEYGYLAYIVSNKEVTIIDCNTSISEKCTIPETLSGYPVTKIGDYAFSGCESLTSITIPDNVTSIGDGAFDNCTSLESITIPSGVTSIGGRAFSDCISLVNIDIPNSIILIEYNMFSGCESLTSITIPDSVTSIGDFAFSGCTSLESIIIPDSVIRIGRYTFSGCESLTSITIPDSVTSIEDWAFAACTDLTNISISSNIGNYAFYLCTSLESVTISGNVTSIGEYAFGYEYWNDHLIPIEGFTIYGYTGTAAERYANNNGLTFVSLGEYISPKEPTSEESSTAEPTTESPDFAANDESVVIDEANKQVTLPAETGIEGFKQLVTIGSFSVTDAEGNALSDM
ncbi:MAG: leucine-rich repeat domain-containing protein [Clostridiales bacterium]|nr:leucine-rich repeat domain-containing protein [Clostridiales bacterium]